MKKSIQQKRNEKSIQQTFNPENIKPGDYVKIKDPRKGDPRGKMLVESVGGTYGNKVFCEKIGHEVYAQCFEKVKIKTKKKSDLLCRPDGGRDGSGTLM